MMARGWLWDLVVSGMRNLLRHKLRSALTLLGVFFGVAAVITMMGIGEGAQRSVMREIAGLGLNNILVDSVQPTTPQPQTTTGGRRRGPRILEFGLTEQDVAQIRAALPRSEVRTAQRVRSRISQGGLRIDAEALGVPPGYFDLFESELVSGRMLSDLDEMLSAPVALVPEALEGLTRPLAGGTPPHIRIGDKQLEIVGVIRTVAPGGSRTIYMPETTARQRFGISTIRREAGSFEFTRTPVSQMIVHSKDENDLGPAAAVVKRTLEANRPQGDYAVTIPFEILKAKQQTQRILNLVLLTIAGISLLVGGIGIMNIMLAIVTERIPEIGVRRALGATRRDILYQFLVETVTLSTLGGVAGCLAGVVAVPLTGRWTGWEGVVTPSSVVVSLLVSWMVGLFFGLAPAIRASRLDPVEALRHE
ncbi:MAG TPA: ABC transporter permease [Kiritimatiellia bacterium]|nr:ABC transporter permease [Kiritimatiellia bacterium]